MLWIVNDCYSGVQKKLIISKSEAVPAAQLQNFTSEDNKFLNLYVFGASPEVQNVNKSVQRSEVDKFLK